MSDNDPLVDRCPVCPACGAEALALFMDDPLDWRFPVGGVVAHTGGRRCLVHDCRGLHDAMEKADEAYVR